MMHPVNKNPDKKELRNFGLITGALLIVFFGLLLPWLFNHSFPRWPWIAGPLLAAWALVLPSSLKYVYRVWMTIGMVLGWINTRVILTLMFYCIILPVGIALRLAGKDPMTRPFAPEQESYRVNSTAQDKSHVERPY